MNSSVLPFLFECKARAAAFTSTFGVVNSWLPLLTQVAETKNQTTASFLSDVIFSGLNLECKLIADNGIHKTEESEKLPVVKRKSGTLDKLPDDCIRHCLSFVSHFDLLKNVERTCHRLLQISRATKKPLTCNRFYGFDLNSKLTLERMLRIVPLINCKALDVSCDGYFEPRNHTINNKVYPIFGDSIESLRVDSESLSVLLPMALSFTSLQYVDFDEVEESEWCAFLRKMPTVTQCHWNYEYTWNPQRFYATLAKCRHIEAISLEAPQCVTVTETVFDPTAFDLSHVSRVNVVLFEHWAPIRPLMHSQLTHLTVDFYETSAKPNSVVELPNLQVLKVGCESYTGEGEFLHCRILDCFKTDASKLKQVTIRGDVTTLIPALRFCPNGDVLVDIQTAEYGDSSLRDEVSKAIAELPAVCGTIAPKSLRIHFSVDRENYDAILPYFRAYKPLIECLVSEMAARTRFVLCVPSNVKAETETLVKRKSVSADVNTLSTLRSYPCWEHPCCIRRMNYVN